MIATDTRATPIDVASIIEDVGVEGDKMRDDARKYCLRRISEQADFSPDKQITIADLETELNAYLDGYEDALKQKGC